MVNNAKRSVAKILKAAGIKLNGEQPWDIQVHNPKLYSRVLAGGSLALGESFMDGWWDVKELDAFFYRVLSAKLDHKVITPKFILTIIASRLFNLQSKSRSKKVAQEHYDLGNEFYENMLDKKMQYTCGYWKNANTLEKAQEDKLDLVCKKLQLKKGDKVLELGCGWGGLAYHMAKKYGCEVEAYNISSEQVDYARKLCKGLPVKIFKKDYRLAKGKFDKVVSVGLCEHVGHKNYRNFMKLVRDRLKDDGLFLLHTIGKDESVSTTDPWIHKYIFPNGMLPSVKQISSAAEKVLVLEDWHNFGVYYDLTLMQWYKNFNKNWPKFEKRYGKRFYRMWKYYLLSCAGLFRARRAQLWQIVFSKDGLKGGYESIR